jgi:hypothetical protein
MRYNILNISSPTLQLLETLSSDDGNANVKCHLKVVSLNKNPTGIILSETFLCPIATGIKI